MPYSTILLDLDHTLLDSDTSLRESFDSTMGAAGLENPAEHYGTFQEINDALWRQVEAATLAPVEVASLRFAQLVEVLEMDANPEELSLQFRQGLGVFGELFPGTREALDVLAQHATLAMITNGLGDVQRARIERLELSDYFQATVISAEVGCTKPGAEIFDIAFEQLGRPGKDSTVMVGDSLSSDIKGGTNYGIATCWYNPHGKTANETDQVTHEISSITQMTELVR